jgi:hypothetical protein
MISKTFSALLVILGSNPLSFAAPANAPSSQHLEIYRMRFITLHVPAPYGGGDAEVTIKNGVIG